MSVPNHASIVQQVYNAGYYDLTTKIGCGRFLEDVVWELHKTDPHWGHLKKRPGQNQWNGHAVDNLLYLSILPGQSQAVDIIGASESSSARLQWAPDVPRYSPADWFAPSGPDSFQMTPHGCRLGASLFYLMAAARGDNLVLARRGQDNLTWITETLHADYIRAFVTVGGRLVNTPSGAVDPWQFAGSFRAWPDFKKTLAYATDWAADFGLAVAWTLVGEGAQFATDAALAELVDVFVEVARNRERKIELVEVWNEYSVTGGNATTIRAMASRLRSKLGSDFPIALDTPQTAMEEPTEQGDPLPAEVSTFYGGSAANVITPQWCRSQPNPRDLGSSAPRIVYSHEPRGPGASAGGDVSDWLPMAHDYIQAALKGHRGYLLHSAAGVWGGMCHPAFPAQNTYANLFDHPNMAAIADALRDVKAGQNPNPSDVEPPMHQIVPYDEAWIQNMVNPQIAKRYAAHGVPLDPGMGIWVARTQYDVAAGMTQNEALAKHLAELESALSGR